MLDGMRLVQCTRCPREQNPEAVSSQSFYYLCEGLHPHRLPREETRPSIGRCFARAKADHQDLKMLERPSASHRPIDATASSQRMPTLLSYLNTKFGRAADVDVFTKPLRSMEPLAQLRTFPLHTTRDIRRYYVRRRTQIPPQSKRSLTSRPATWVRHSSGSRTRRGRRGQTGRAHQSRGILLFLP